MPIFTRKCDSKTYRQSEPAEFNETHTGRDAWPNTTWATATASSTWG